MKTPGLYSDCIFKKYSYIKVKKGSAIFLCFFKKARELEKQENTSRVTGAYLGTNNAGQNKKLTLSGRGSIYAGKMV